MNDGTHDKADREERLNRLAGTETILRWHDPDRAPFRLSGFPWYTEDGVYRRFPMNPNWELTDAVDRLANSTAGGQIAFRTDAKHIAVRVELTGPADMNHMPSTGQCGFDLYAGTPPGRHYYSTTKFPLRQTSYEILLFEDPEADLREFTFNFPLYKGVNSVQVGLTPDAVIQPPTPWSVDGRVVIYGTSITQGGCACRPGMAYTNILSRTLNVEIINLGFSGSGRGEPDVIRNVASVPNTRLFVLDYEANSGGRQELAKTLPVAIDLIRQMNPETPVLVVSRIRSAREASNANAFRAREESRDMQAAVVEGKRSDGDANVHFFDGSTLLGDDFDECTVDGSHPTDLGFLRMARGLEDTLRGILEAGEQE